MQAELNSEVALSAANALVAHLRKNPAAAMKPAADLAAEFGLDESFVSQVLQGIHPLRKVEVRHAPPRKGPIRALGGAVKRLWLKATDRPILFVGLSFVASIVALVAISALEPYFPKHRTGAGISVGSLMSLLLTLGAIGTTFALHIGVYFRHRSARHALYGGLVVFAGLVVLMSWGLFRGELKTNGASAPSQLVLFLLAVTGMLFIALVYTGAGALAAVLGGWTRFKLQERQEESMSRQDLLERYFELQSRLRSSAYPRPGVQGPPILSSPAMVWYRQNQFLANLAVGFLVSLLAAICLAASGITPGEPQPEINAWFFVLMLINISQFLVYILQGYVSNSFWRAAAGSLCLTAGRLLVRFLPIGGLLNEAVSMRDAYGVEAADAVLMLLFSMAGYLGSIVQNRAVREMNLQRNDQATLLAEMVRIQWKLSNEASTICVMVVDAAKSSEMKADADPLAVEYTFREYQEWIGAVCAKRGGRVHSTAGDGAVVAFSTCGLALSAARKIQTDVFQFNKDVNRLDQPFRLRIGLHTGEVVGDINQVQFTEVIDISAHIEAACPIGGIAVSGEVAARLPDEEFIDLNMSVDGEQVFMVAKPTEYQ